MRLSAAALLVIAVTSPLQGGAMSAESFYALQTTKYLVGRDGKVVAYFPSKVAPDSKELRDAIEAALGR